MERGSKVKNNSLGNSFENRIKFYSNLNGLFNCISIDCVRNRIEN